MELSQKELLRRLECLKDVPSVYLRCWLHLRSISIGSVLSMSDLLRMQTTGVGGTTKTFRDSCLEVQSLQDPDIPIQIKSCVKDLGELVHYNKSASIGFICEKLKKVFEGSKELNGCRVNYKKGIVHSDCSMALCSVQL